MKCVELKMRADTFFVLHGKKAISGVQNCTEKKRSQVCKIAPKKSDLTCAKLHGKKAISRVQKSKLKCLATE